MDMINLAHFKELLTVWLEELQSHADKTIGELLSMETEIGDFTDRASLETDRSTLLRIRDRESLLIRKIKKSLADIESGEYGICEDCGDGIAIGRLKARPIARRCITCKTKQEIFEKSTQT
jgi:DnaK suppressor protein